MKLSDLLREVECEGRYDGELDITNVTDDTEKVKDGTLFVCIKHRSFDGHKAAVYAIKLGAKAVVTQSFLGVKNEINVKNSREAYAKICSNFYKNPERKLNMLAVTGTNGKTTVSNLIRSIFLFSGEKCAMLGTVQNFLGKEVLDSSLTTPKPPELYKMLEKVLESGCKSCVLEASSQALEQGRLFGIDFLLAVFTNITPEHLDYHGTFKSYLESKLILFKNAHRAVINLDSPYSGEFIKSAKNAVTYSLNNDYADYTAKNIKLKENSVSYEIVSKDEIFHIDFDSVGTIAVENSMAAAVAARVCGIDAQTIRLAVKNFKGVEGRMEELNLPVPFKIYVDYAHTQDSLLKLLQALRVGCKNRLILLFGCGGDRDRQKRPEMMKVACQNADAAIVTSDNPRTESPQKIIDEILSGKIKSKCKVYVQKDRRKAIRLALKIAREGDTVVLAGKGHEKVQIIGREKLPFDEREEVREALTEFQIMQGDEK